MIVDTILKAVFTLVNGILAPLPAIEIDLDPAFMDSFYDYLHVILWLLPCGTISAILVCHLSICGFRILVSVIKTIWQLLPFV